ncbi:MAG: hypothetical protein ACRC6E_09900 [Fusobacteriaceae bacterium]
MEKFMIVAKKMFGDKVEEYQERAAKMTQTEIDLVLKEFKATDPQERKKILDSIKSEIK